MVQRIKRKIINLLSKCSYLSKRYSHEYYKSKVLRKAPWAYVSYITDVFFLKDESVFGIHQNKKEAIKIVDILNHFGYNVYVQDYQSSRSLPSKKFDLVFGLEPNFERACIQNPNALKIYYATGAYYQHQNSQILDITDKFNLKFNANIPYRRLIQPHNSCEIADKIFQIGSQFTIETYPPAIQQKIVLIRQSTQATIIKQDVAYADENEFLFMGSSGNLLRGLSFLIDYFSTTPQLTLHIVGPIEDDFYEAIKIKITGNIQFHGFLDINGSEFHSIVSRCNFIIYPSGSEGCPGSVLNAMKNGLIPIVTRWAAFDEITNYGFIIDKWDISAIGSTISRALLMSKEEIIIKKKACADYVLSNYSIGRFIEDFEQCLQNLLS